MSTLFKYADFVARRFSETKTDTHSHAFLTTPTSIGGRTEAANRVWLSLPDWVHAHGLFLDILEGMERPSALKKHAAIILKELEKMDALDEGVELMKRCSKWAPIHGNSRYPATLYHTDGRQVSGDAVSLSAATGLEYNHVRDLVHGRRRYYSGWCGSEKEAKRGKLRPGKKPKPRSFYTEGTPWF